MAPLPVSSDLADPPFFDSLNALLDTGPTRPVPSRHAAPIVALTPRLRSPGQARLLVCHDFKGGYCERDDERGYTLQYWDLVDVFVYFSHHRVSPPPSQWITASHRNHTKILGTVIFEWQEGALDLSHLSRKHADRLVDLCLERGFDGWLVNVEVDGIGEEGAEKVRGWLAYLKRQVGQRVPHGEVIWYDAVTTEGKLRWQSSLTKLNAPFLTSSNALFTDYHWRPPASLSSSLSYLAQNLPYHDPSSIFFGIDVYGRGQHGGGGFETSIALSAIQEASTSLSVALFAPGWTVENELLGHDLTSIKGWKEWHDDERFLWEGVVPSSPASRDRVERVRKHLRGERRVRELAGALHGRVPWPKSPIGLFRYDGELDVLSPITSFFKSGKPAGGEAFVWTDFGVGSGNGWFHHGQRVSPVERGWTKVDFTSKTISMLVEGSWRRVEDDAWSGSGCVAVEIKRSGSTPLCSCRVDVKPNDRWVGSVVYKASAGLMHGVRLAVGSGTTRDGLTSEESSTTGNLENGWRRTSAIFTSKTSLEIDWIGIDCPSNDIEILIDSLSLTPLPSDDSASIAQVHIDGNFIRWSASSPIGGEWMYFTVWRNDDELVGWTRATEFALSEGGGVGGRWKVVGVLADGREVSGSSG